MRDHYGILIGTGLDKIRTFTLRIGTMGVTASPHYVLPTLSALELALRDLGYKAAAVNLSDLAASGAHAEALLVTLAAPRRFIQILKRVQVVLGDAFGELRPHAHGFRAEVEIDFANPVIGRRFQRWLPGT